MRVIEGDPPESEVATSTPLLAVDRAGVGQGRTTCRNRVTPVEGGALTSGALSTMARKG